MIRNRREVVDLRGIAELHGLSWHTARRRRPWADIGHPPPVTSATRRIPALYDAKQAAAYADGRRVPPLPTRDHPRDLLDAQDARRLLDLTESTWRVYDHEGRLPAPDSAPYGVPHWYRTTLLTWAKRRPGPGWWGEHLLAASAGERARRAIEHAATFDEPITDAELARLAGVSRPTLRKARADLTTRKPSDHTEAPVRTGQQQQGRHRPARHRGPRVTARSTLERPGLHVGDMTAPARRRSICSLRNERCGFRRR